MDRDLISEELFPKVNFCFAYGSGAVFQADYKKDEDKMLDLVFVVDNPLEWHTQNLVNNPHHYASHMRALGPSVITHVQDGWVAGVYYNTLIPMRSHPNRSMKYGVISRKELEKDLSSWHTLYLAGRLHKPVVFMSAAPPDAALSSMLKSNLSNAVKTSLYLLPEHFSKYELYLAIAGLSYSGDFRMLFGENPDKVKNIVTPNLHLFDKLYQGVLKEMGEFVDSGTTDVDAMCSQDMSPNTRQLLYGSLPGILRPGVRVEPVSVIKSRLQSIVMRSSLKQSLKGVVTAGPAKSVNYTSAKIAKWASGWGKRVLK